MSKVSVEEYRVAEMLLHLVETPGLAGDIKVSPVLAWESEGNAARGALAYGDIVAVILDAGKATLTVEYAEKGRIVRMEFATSAALLKAYGWIAAHLCGTNLRVATPASS